MHPVSKMPRIKACKRRYRRSTAVGRCRKNAAKSMFHLRLVSDRLLSWGRSHETLESARRYIDEVADDLTKIDGYLASLESCGYVPPKKSYSVCYAKGDLVSICKPYRRKYELAFAAQIAEDPSLLDELIVVDVLPSKELVVRRGKRTPFLVRKTHVAKIRGER